MNQFNYTGLQLYFSLLVFSIFSTGNFIPVNGQTVSDSVITLIDTVKFSGEVFRGEVYQARVTDNLTFRLLPSSRLNPNGWLIWIGDTTKIGKNFCSVVTPPFHGITSLYIEGWHFRNSDNTGPNEPGEKNINAPQEEREFNFVTNEDEYEIGYNASNITLLATEQEQLDASQKFWELNYQKGFLTITELRLNNLVEGEQAWIESMNFNVVFIFKNISEVKN